MAKNGSSTNGAEQIAADPIRSERARLVDHVEVVCEAVLGRGAITIGGLDRLAPGEVLALDASPADLAEVQVNGKVVARGEIVTVDDRFAIRITEIG